MPDQPNYEFSVVFVPEERGEYTYGTPFKGSFCLSPHVLSGEMPPTGKELLQYIQKAVETVSNENPTISLQAGYLTEKTAGVKVRLVHDWSEIWKQGNKQDKSTTILEQLWSALVPAELPFRPFVAETLPLVQADNSAQAHEQARAGRQAVESVSLDDLEYDVNTTYADIALHLCPPLPRNGASPPLPGAPIASQPKDWNLEAAQKAATEAFRDKLAAKYDDQIERFTTIGSVRAPEKLSSGENGGGTKITSDDFHEVFTRLLEFPKLMRLLGLIIDVEIEEQELRKCLEHQPIPVKPPVNLFFKCETDNKTTLQPFTRTTNPLNGPKVFRLDGATPFLSFERLIIPDLDALIKRLNDLSYIPSQLLWKAWENDAAQQELLTQVKNYHPSPLPRPDLKRQLENLLDSYPKKDFILKLFPVELGPSYRLLQTDVMAPTIQAYQMRRAGGVEKQAEKGPPPLRSSGIALIHGSKTQALDRAAGHSDLPGFGAEDLLRGEVVHVSENSGPWKSLMRRQSVVAIHRNLKGNSLDTGTMLVLWLKNGASEEIQLLNALPNGWGALPPIKTILQQHNITKKLAEEDTCQTLAMHQSPQPISGVVLLGSEDNLVVSTHQGDIRVVLKKPEEGKTKAGEAKPHLDHYHEYQFEGALEKATEADFSLNDATAKETQDAFTGTVAWSPKSWKPDASEITLTLQDSQASLPIVFNTLRKVPPATPTSPPWWQDLIAQIWPLKENEIVQAVVRGEHQLVGDADETDLLYTPRISRLKQLLLPQVLHAPTGLDLEDPDFDLGTFRRDIPLGTLEPSDIDLFDAKGVQIKDPSEIHQNNNTFIYYQSAGKNPASNKRFQILPDEVTLRVGDKKLLGSEMALDWSKPIELDLELATRPKTNDPKVLRLSLPGEASLYQELLEDDTVHVLGLLDDSKKTFTPLRIRRRLANGWSLAYIMAIDGGEANFQYHLLGDSMPTISPLPRRLGPRSMPVPQLDCWALVKVEFGAVTDFIHIPASKQFWGILISEGGQLLINSAIGKWPVKGDLVDKLQLGATMRALLPATPDSRDQGEVRECSGLGIVQTQGGILGVVPIHNNNIFLKPLQSNPSVSENDVVRFVYDGTNAKVTATTLTVQITGLEPNTPESFARISDLGMLVGDNILEKWIVPPAEGSPVFGHLLANKITREKLQAAMGQYVLVNNVSQRFTAEPENVMLRPQTLQGYVIDRIQEGGVTTGCIFRAFDPVVPDLPPLTREKLKTLIPKVPGTKDLDVDKILSSDFYKLFRATSFPTSADFNLLFSTYPNPNDEEKKFLNRIALHDFAPLTVPKWPVYFDVFIKAKIVPDREDLTKNPPLKKWDGTQLTEIVPPPLPVLQSAIDHGLSYLNLMSQAIVNWNGWSLAVEHPLEQASEDFRFQRGTLNDRVSLLKKRSSIAWKTGPYANEPDGADFEMLINDFIQTQKEVGALDNKVTDKNKNGKATPKAVDQSNRPAVLKNLKFILSGFSARTQAFWNPKQLTPRPPLPDSPQFRRYAMDDFLDWLAASPNDAEKSNGKLNLLSVGGLPPGPPPLLEQGGDYRLRICPMYLGGSITDVTKDSGVPEASEVIRYRRSDPIAAPSVYAVAMPETDQTGWGDPKSHEVTPARQLVFSSQWQDSKYVPDPTVPVTKELRILPPEIPRDPRTLVMYGLLDPSDRASNERYNLTAGSQLKTEVKDAWRPVPICRDPMAARLCVSLTGSPFTWSIREGDIEDLNRILQQLIHSLDGSFHLQIWNSFSPQSKTDLADESKIANDKITWLTEQLNAVLLQPASQIAWYDPQRVTLRPQTAALAQSRPLNAKLLRLKRLVLEDAFEGALTHRPIAPQGTGDGSLPVQFLEFEGKWPWVKPVPIVVSAVASGELSIVSDNGVLHVKIPPGEVAELKFSATVLEQNYDLLQLSHIMTEKAAPEQCEQVKQTVLSGQHALVSGSASVRLIHAVNKPAEPPRFLAGGLGVAMDRQRGSRSVRIICRPSYEPNTTGRLLLTASWPVYSDNIRQIAPTVPLAEVARCFDPFLERWTERQMQNLLMLLLPLSDTQRENRLASFLPEDLTSQEKSFLTRMLRQFVRDMTHSQVVFSSPFARPVPGQSPKFEPHDFVQNFDDTACRVVSYAPVAATCFDPLVKIAESNEGVPQDLLIPATTAPLIPEIAYVMPLYGWNTQDRLREQGTFVQERKGFGLRIFLRQPWYTSGQGEKLAVIFPHHWKPDGSVKKLITEWGYDPVWTRPSDAKKLWRHLMASDVGLQADQSGFAESVVSDLAPKAAAPPTPGKPGESLDAVVHPVRYSPSRGLWYCDVVFTEECEHLYSPFIRLAVARYQPNALADARLSEIIQLEFIPLSNSRSAMLKRDPNGTFKLQVTGVFPGKDTKTPEDVSPIHQAARWTSSIVEVSLVEIPRNSDDDAQGLSTLGATDRRLINPDNGVKLASITLNVPADGATVSTRDASFNVPDRSNPDVRRCLRLVERQTYGQRGNATNVKELPIPYATLIPID